GREQLDLLVGGQAARIGHVDRQQQVRWGLVVGAIEAPALDAAERRDDVRVAVRRTVLHRERPVVGRRRQGAVLDVGRGGAEGGHVGVPPQRVRRRLGVYGHH